MCGFAWYVKKALTTPGFFQTQAKADLSLGRVSAVYLTNCVMLIDNFRCPGRSKDYPRVCEAVVGEGNLILVVLQFEAIPQYLAAPPGHLDPAHYSNCVPW